MKYTMTVPCTECPFLRQNNFTFAALVAHASGEFGCHKACDLDEDEGVYEPHEQTPHCAGALIFNHKRDAPHPVQKIAERLGIYDPRTLDLTANVGSRPSDYRAGYR